MAGPNAPYSGFDERQVLDHVFDILNDALRVRGEFSGTVTVPPATKVADRAFDVVNIAPVALNLGIIGVDEDVYFVNLKADINNAESIYYSTRSNVTVSGVSRGFQLNPGDEKTLPVYKGVDIYVIAPDLLQKAFYEVLNGG